MPAIGTLTWIALKRLQYVILVIFNKIKLHSMSEYSKSATPSNKNGVGGGGGGSGEGKKSTICKYL